MKVAEIARPWAKIAGVLEVGPIEALRYLMQTHGLTQSDLPEVGNQGVVSEILAGNLELNVRQVRALGERFGMDPAVFL